MKNRTILIVIFVITLISLYTCKNILKEIALNIEARSIFSKRIDSAYPNDYRERIPISPTLLDSIMSRKKEIISKFLQEFPNSAVSTEKLNNYKTHLGKSDTQKLFDLLTIEQQKSKKGKLISKYLKLNAGVKLFDQFIDFEMKDTEGKKNKISMLRGEYTLIEFWASWCGPCRESNKDLIKVYNNYKSKGFKIIGISSDKNKYKWINAIKNDKLIWKNLSELNGKDNTAFYIYNIKGIPDNILIDPKGKIIGRKIPSSSLGLILEILIDGKHENKLPFLIMRGNIEQDTIIYIEKR